MYSREEWNRLREARQKAVSRAGIPLVAFSVPFGFIQLAVGKWMDRDLDRATRTPIALGMFVVYMIVVGILLWRYLGVANRLSPVCPACGSALKDMSERVASATGRCDKCGGQVIAS